MSVTTLVECLPNLSWVACPLKSELSFLLIPIASDKVLRLQTLLFMLLRSASAEFLLAGSKEGGHENVLPGGFGH